MKNVFIPSAIILAFSMLGICEFIDAIVHLNWYRIGAHIGALVIALIGIVYFVEKNKPK
jgi:hypothetical protein